MASDTKQLQGFTFFRSYYEAAKELPDKQRLAFYDAVIQYALNGDEPRLTGLANSMFLLTKPTLDKSRAQSRTKDDAGATQPEPNLNPNQPQQRPRQAPNETQSQTWASKDKDKDEDKGLRSVDEERDKDEDNTPPPPKGGCADATPNPPTISPFDRFWDVYPRKIGKKAAKKAWDKLRPDAALITKILEAIPQAIQSREWQRDQGQYIPNPATWLNQGRWDDKLTPGGGDGREQTATAGGGFGRPTAPREDWSNFTPSAGFKRSDTDGQ